MCEKHVYTKRDAAYVVNFARTGPGGRHYKGKRRPVRYYYCRECRGWHVTSQKSESKSGGVKV